MYLPSLLAGFINQAFNPPALYNAEEGAYEASANATPPYVAIVIGGVEFEIASEALLPTSFAIDNSTNLYFTGVQYSTDIYILGDTFLTNVVAYFDVGNGLMQFAASG